MTDGQRRPRREAQPAGITQAPDVTPGALYPCPAAPRGGPPLDTGAGLGRLSGARAVRDRPGGMYRHARAEDGSRGNPWKLNSLFSAFERRCGPPPATEADGGASGLAAQSKQTL